MTLEQMYTDDELLRRWDEACRLEYRRRVRDRVAREQSRALASIPVRQPPVNLYSKWPPAELAAREFLSEARNREIGRCTQFNNGGGLYPFCLNCLADEGDHPRWY